MPARSSPAPPVGPTSPGSVRNAPALEYTAGAPSTVGRGPSVSRMPRPCCVGPARSLTALPLARVARCLRRPRDHPREFLSDREFRLLLAVATNTPVRPIDPQLAGLFAEEENLGRLPVRAAFDRLAELEPGLRELESSKVSAVRTPARLQNDGHRPGREQDLVGIRARSGMALLRSDSSDSIARQYLGINAGRIKGTSTYRLSIASTSVYPADSSSMAPADPTPRTSYPRMQGDRGPQGATLLLCRRGVAIHQLPLTSPPTKGEVGTRGRLVWSIESSSATRSRR